VLGEGGYQITQERDERVNTSLGDQSLCTPRGDPLVLYPFFLHKVYNLHSSQIKVRSKVIYSGNILFPTLLNSLNEFVLCVCVWREASWYWLCMF
jgi:hypothetical protein